MATYTDILGYNYDDTLPAFVIAGQDTYYHRATNRYLRKSEVEVRRTRRDGEAPPNEIGKADEWALSTLMIDTSGFDGGDGGGGDGGGGDELSVSATTDELSVTATAAGGTAPYDIDWGDGTNADSGVSAPVTHTYTADGEYTITVTDADAATATTTVTVAADVPDPVIAPVITSPTDGTTVTDPNYAVSGTGAEPSGDVMLWSSLRDPDVDEPIETVTAGGDGTFTFDAGAAVAEGATTWFVTSGGETSPSITVTYTPEAPAAQSGYASLGSHATIDEWATNNGVTTPGEWSTMTIAAKKTWLDNNYQAN